MSHLNLKSLKVIVCDFSPMPMFSIISSGPGCCHLNSAGRIIKWSYCNQRRHSHLALVRRACNLKSGEKDKMISKVILIIRQYGAWFLQPGEWGERHRCRLQAQDSAQVGFRSRNWENDPETEKNLPVGKTESGSRQRSGFFSIQLLRQISLLDNQPQTETNFKV